MSATPVEVALAVPVRGGKILVTRRAKGAHLPGLWEFPGGKIGPGEPAADAARRELAEETGLTGGSIETLSVFKHPYDDRVVRLHVFVLREPEGDVKIDGGRAYRWIACDELVLLPMPGANGPIVRALEGKLA